MAQRWAGVFAVVASALACAGTVTPPPAPPPVVAEPVARPAGVDRSKHDGLRGDVRTWEVMSAAFDPVPAHLVILWGSRKGSTPRPSSPDGHSS
jgi:hypothetical protein